MWKRVFEIVKKEFIQVLRDPRMRVILFIPPIVETILFGYAINMDVKNISIAWMDMDNTAQSREVLAAFEGSPYFHVRYTPGDESEVKEVLDYGRVNAVVRVLPGFGRDIIRGKKSGIQILLDGTDSNTASVIAGYFQQLMADLSARILSRRGDIRLYIINQAGDSHPGSNLQIARRRPDLGFDNRVWFNPELKSRYYFVTGVIVNIIALVTIMLTAMAIVREKEIGTMEQLMVTPIRPVELILGKTLPFALVGLIDVILITIVAKIVFTVPFRGSCCVLFIASLLFLLTTLGAGLFISTISHTQQQALMTTFFFMMPSIMLSGFAFPIRNMPALIQYLTYLNPLRYYMEIVRSLFLKGTGIPILYPQMTGLAILGLIVMSLSVLRFHKRLD